MRNPAVWQQQCPDQCLCEVHSQTTRLGLLANCVLLAVTSLQPPCVVQRQTSHPQIQQLLAAEDYSETTATSRISVLQTPRPRQRVPRLQAHDQLVFSDPQQFCTVSCCHQNSRCCRWKVKLVALSPIHVTYTWYNGYHSEVMYFCLHCGKLLSHPKCFPKGSL